MELGHAPSDRAAPRVATRCIYHSDDIISVRQRHANAMRTRLQERLCVCPPRTLKYEHHYITQTAFNISMETELTINNYIYMYRSALH